MFQLNYSIVENFKNTKKNVAPVLHLYVDLNFIYCEKATKFEKKNSSILFWHL